MGDGNPPEVPAIGCSTYSPHPTTNHLTDNLCVSDKSKRKAEPRIATWWISLVDLPCPMVTPKNLLHSHCVGSCQLHNDRTSWKQWVRPGMHQPRAGEQNPVVLGVWKQNPVSSSPWRTGRGPRGPEYWLEECSSVRLWGSWVVSPVSLYSVVVHRKRGGGTLQQAVGAFRECVRGEDEVLLVLYSSRSAT